MRIGGRRFFPYLILFLFGVFCFWRFSASLVTPGRLERSRLAPDGDTAMLMAGSQGVFDRRWNQMPDEQDDEQDELTAARRETLAEQQMT